jgi:hypothetical protein
MFIALAITLFYVILVWFVFFKARWLKFNIVWGVVSFWVGAHLLLIFLISLRFYQPYSLDAYVIRPTIQIVPRLPEPTLLTVFWSSLISSYRKVRRSIASTILSIG